MRPDLVSATLAAAPADVINGTIQERFKACKQSGIWLDESSNQFDAGTWSELSTNPHALTIDRPYQLQHRFRLNSCPSSHHSNRQRPFDNHRRTSIKVLPEFLRRPVCKQPVHIKVWGQRTPVVYIVSFAERSLITSIQIHNGER